LFSFSITGIPSEVRKHAELCQIEAVGIHDLRPCGNEVLHELLLVDDGPSAEIGG
jgi:hypothetical protein